MTFYAFSSSKYLFLLSYNLHPDTVLQSVSMRVECVRTFCNPLTQGVFYAHLCLVEFSELGFGFILNQITDIRKYISPHIFASFIFEIRNSAVAVGVLTEVCATISRIETSR